MAEPGMPVEVELDGQQYPLVFTLRTLKALQKDHGINLLRITVNELTDPEKLALVLWYGLKQSTPETTLDWVEDHVDAPRLLKMVPALAEAISGKTATPVPNALTPASPPTGIGSTSGQLDDTTSGLVNGRSGV